MKVRAKFKCDRVERVQHAHGSQAKIVLVPVTNDTAENKSFWQYTPSGELVMDCVNEAVTEKFKPGNEYYIDFTPADAATE